MGGARLRLPRRAAFGVRFGLQRFFQNGASPTDWRILPQSAFRRARALDAQGRLLIDSPLEKPFARLMFCTSGTPTWDKEALPFNRNSFSWRVARGAWRVTERRSEVLCAHWRARVSDDRVAREVTEMLGDSNSDCAFSWRWMSLSKTERRRLKWKMANGNWNQCEAVLRAIAWQNWPAQNEEYSQRRQIRGPGKEPPDDLDFDDGELEKTQFWAGNWECVNGEWYHQHLSIRCHRSKFPRAH